jgi:hypothetical protein
MFPRVCKPIIIVQGYFGWDIIYGYACVQHMYGNKRIYDLMINVDILTFSCLPLLYLLGLGELDVYSVG